MDKEKFTLTEINRGYLRSLRKKRNLAAEDVSVELGFSKAWLGQVERGKFQTIKYHDLARLMAIYFPEWTVDELKSNGVIENYLEYGLAIETMDEFFSKLTDLDFNNTFNKCIEHASTYEEKEKIFRSIENLLDCADYYPEAMSILLMQVNSLNNLLDNFDCLPREKNLRCVRSLAAKINLLLQDEYEYSEYLLKQAEQEDGSM